MQNHKRTSGSPMRTSHGQVVRDPPASAGEVDSISDPEDFTC